ncbi:hypothetical protein NCCP2222_23530 [Sporosarcina sp. NCCP-2222]|uniref:hypothetical protein n=1 Tax=Sporosarcina sp. NCCP-2222 TaxID=2935073 RepID=UPI0020851463|nr:hypothetical protein [Sporosarcina sp. NCCP-2222]GKV56406.1 hypothetical protein NCCP2222_23530 [Sporosarcina sp. NCCP-2222]
MDSLQVAEDGKSVYLRMDDEQEAKTAEDVFESKQRIFNIPLAKPERMEIISNPQSDQDIYDFLLLPEKNEIIYQAVAGTGKNGIFEYELFVYHTENGSIEQLTALKEHAASPKRGPDGKIYFLVDRNFGHGDPDYYLYQMSEDGTDITEVPW